MSDYARRPWSVTVMGIANIRGQPRQTYVVHDGDASLRARATIPVQQAPFIRQRRDRSLATGESSSSSLRPMIAHMGFHGRAMITRHTGPPAYGSRAFTREGEPEKRSTPAVASAVFSSQRGDERS